MDREIPRKSKVSARLAWRRGHQIIPALSDLSTKEVVFHIDLDDLRSHNLALPENEVHLWHASLHSHSADKLESALTADEIARAHRFHFEKDRNHFTVSRALLRKLLSAYLRTDQVQISYGQKGKPFLTETEMPISFNLAHSGGRAIYAFAPGRELGVDIEQVREDAAVTEIASRFFSAQEIETLHALPKEQRKVAFFNCWTRKEAYIKARGEGLSIPLDTFDVSLAPEEIPALLRHHVDEAETGKWEMRSVEVAPGYVGAIVVEGRGWTLKTFEIAPGIS